MRKDKERAFLDRAALTVYGALITQCKDGNPQFTDLSAQAWRAANVFLYARYEAVLEKYSGIEALLRIVEMDGARGQGVTFMVGLYAEYPDPLKAYAEDHFIMGQAQTTGQIAVARWLEKKAKEGIRQ